MVRNSFVGWCVSVAAVILPVTWVVLSAAPAASQTLMSESEARQKLSREFGVEVLRVTADERGGTPVFVVRVMNPEGNFNSALRVSVLMVDRRTGQLMRQFRHKASGVTDPPEVRNDTSGDIGPVLRRKSVP